jgi:hypothetical protein
MEVDRGRFLKLVAALASATAVPMACATSNPEPQVVSVPLDIKPIAEAKKPAAIAAAGPPLEVAAEPPPSADPSTSSLGIWALPYDSSAPPKTCAQLKCPGPTQEAMGALRMHCKVLSEGLRPEAFQRFMTCMMAHNNTPDTCDLTLVDDEPGSCLEKWSSPPAIDPATAAKCKPIVAACAGPNRSIHASGPLTLDACQRMFSATSVRADRKMIHCAIEYCDGAPGLCQTATMF